MRFFQREQVASSIVVDGRRNMDLSRRDTGIAFCLAADFAPARGNGYIGTLLKCQAIQLQNAHFGFQYCRIFVNALRSIGTGTAAQVKAPVDQIDGERVSVIVCLPVEFRGIVRSRQCAGGIFSRKRVGWRSG